MVERDLVNIWNAVEEYKEYELLVQVYCHFLNDVFKANHIEFFIQTHRVID